MVKLNLICFVLPSFYVRRCMSKPQNHRCAQGRLRSAWPSSQSLMCALWTAKDSMVPDADSEDSGQAGRMARLIWVFAGRTAHIDCHAVAHLCFRRHQVILNYIKMNVSCCFFCLFFFFFAFVFVFFFVLLFHFYNPKPCTCIERIG